jgi:dihydroxyacetone kinase-like protein
MGDLIMSTASLTQFTDWIARFGQLIADQRSYLTELDTEIGDADHGSNMARGLDAVAEKVDTASAEYVDDYFRQVGMTLVSSVGGASGPLYGTFFLRFAASAAHVTELDAAGLAQALRAGLGGVLDRGKPQLGDKTMFDAMSPAVEAFDAAVDGPISAAARAASDAAGAGRDATAPLVARKGRASYLGERSVGHIDPGAASTALLFQALADALA